MKQFNINDTYVYIGKSKWLLDNDNIKTPLFKNITYLKYIKKLKNNRKLFNIIYPNCGGKKVIALKGSMVKKEKRKTLFLSNTNRDGSKDYALRLYKRVSLIKRGYIRGLKYAVFSFTAGNLFQGANLTDYMSAINDFDYVVGIISNEYMKSLPCMFELSTLTKDFPSIKPRVLLYVVRRNIAANNELGSIDAVCDLNKYNNYWHKYVTKDPRIHVINNNINQSLNYINLIYYGIDLENDYLNNFAGLIESLDF